MIIAFTGHRLERMPYMFFHEYIRQQLIDKLLELKPKGVIQGMAQGFDQLGAQVCKELGIKYVAAIPWPGHVSAHPTYKTLMEDAHKIIYVSKVYSKNVYFIRDYWMVDHADVVISAYDGKPYGGTYKTIEYAKQQGKQIYNLWK